MRAIFAHGMTALYQGQTGHAWAQVRYVLPDGPAGEPGDDWFPLAMAAQYLAVELGLSSGDLGTAHAWLKARERWLDWSGATLWRAESQLLWARYCVIAGDMETAAHHAQESLTLASDPRQPLVLLATHRLLGELATEAGEFDTAATHLNESLALAEACVIPFERALTLLAIAEMNASRGDPAEARELLAEVRRICTELGARPTLERAEKLAARLTSGTAASRYGLSDRELEVLRLLVEGRSNKEIGDELYISPRTVMQHVSSILRKLDVENRSAVAARAIRENLI